MPGLNPETLKSKPCTLNPKPASLVSGMSASGSVACVASVQSLLGQGLEVSRVLGCGIQGVGPGLCLGLGLELRAGASWGVQG